MQDYLHCRSFASLRMTTPEDDNTLTFVADPSLRFSFVVSRSCPPPALRATPASGGYDCCLSFLVCRFSFVVSPLPSPVSRFSFLVHSASSLLASLIFISSINSIIETFTYCRNSLKSATGIGAVKNSIVTTYVFFTISAMNTV